VLSALLQLTDWQYLAVHSSVYDCLLDGRLLEEGVRVRAPVVDDHDDGEVGKVDEHLLDQRLHHHLAEEDEEEKVDKFDWRL
jgi:hypothetical protein